MKDPTLRTIPCTCYSVKIKILMSYTLQNMIKIHYCQYDSSHKFARAITKNATLSFRWIFVSHFFFWRISVKGRSYWEWIEIELAPLCAWPTYSQKIVYACTSFFNHNIFRRHIDVISTSSRWNKQNQLFSLFFLCRGTQISFRLWLSHFFFFILKCDQNGRSLVFFFLF